jgi:hypothetical protein
VEAGLGTILAKLSPDALGFVCEGDGEITVGDV